MKLQIRKKQIEKLRSKELTYEEIGSKFKISAERVRQILTDVIEFCDRHNRQFIGQCSYCKIENEYVDRVHKIVADDLMGEIHRLSQHNRKREMVIQRIALIKLMRNKYEFTFNQIAKLLERDRNAIINLYNKNYE
jgi:DNA-directed RNA polymerase sigma subunit (sigma70/sigma32)